MARSRSLADLSDVELLDMLDEAKDEATNLRFQQVTGQLDDVNLLGRSRRQVARLLTELRAREIDTAAATVARRIGEAAEAAESTEATESADGGARVFKRRRRRDG